MVDERHGRSRGIGVDTRRQHAAAALFIGRVSGLGIIRLVMPSGRTSTPGSGSRETVGRAMTGGQVALNGLFGPGPIAGEINGRNCEDCSAVISRGVTGLNGQTTAMDVAKGAIRGALGGSESSLVS